MHVEVEIGYDIVLDIEDAVDFDGLVVVDSYNQVAQSNFKAMCADKVDDKFDLDPGVDFDEYQSMFDVFFVDFYYYLLAKTYNLLVVLSIYEEQVVP